MLFVFRGDADSVRLVAELIAAERACCRFLTFGGGGPPEHGAVDRSANGTCRQQGVREQSHMRALRRLQHSPIMA